MIVMEWKMSGMTRRAIVDLSEFEVPREFCGLLVRVPGSNYLCLRPMRNVAEAENEYLVDMDDHLEAIVGGADVKGVVHSHVKTSAALSALDREMGVPGFLYAVYSIRDDSLQAWTLGRRKDNGEAWMPVRLLVDDD